MTKTLPEYNGAVIRLHASHDGLELFGAAILTLNPPEADGPELVWCVAGFDGAYAPEDFAELISRHEWAELTTAPVSETTTTEGTTHA